MGCHTIWILLIWFTSNFVKLNALPANTREFGARLSALHTVPYTSLPKRTQTLTDTTPPSSNNVGNNITRQIWQLMPHDVELQRLQVFRTFEAKESGVPLNQPKSGKTDRSYRKSLSQSGKSLPIPAPNDAKDLSSKEGTTKKDKANTHQKLVPSSNLHFNNIEPFWPFSNVTSAFLSGNFETNSNKDLHNFQFPFANLPDRFKDTTFFFSHVGPNSFEYRAQFHHAPNSYEAPKVHLPKDEFKTFVNSFPEFPKLTFPKFPTFQEEEPELLRHKPQFPDFFDSGKFQFPTVPPSIKRILHNSNIEGEPEQSPVEPENIEGPLKTYNIVLGEINTKFPKIFRFNEERINIQDFERQKKLNSLSGNLLLEPENVQRNHLLILHGGIFTVKEPPLYQKKVIRKRKHRMFHSNRISKH